MSGDPPDPSNVFAVTPGAHCTRDLGADADLIWCTASIAELTGHDAKALIAGAPRWRALVHPDDQIPLWTQYARAAATRAPFQAEYRVEHADGGPRWIRETGRGEAEGRLVTHLADVGETRGLRDRLRAREAAHREERARMQHALDDADQRIAAFAFGAAHELRTSLRAVNAYAGMLVEGEANDEVEARGFAERIRTASRRMNGVLDGLVALGNPQSLTLAPPILLDLAALVRNLAEAQAARHGLPLRFEAPTRVRVSAPPELLQRALEPLVENALRASAPRGVARLHLELTTVGERTVYALRDEGVGFHAEEAARLLEPFRRGHPRSVFPGAGIGLTLAARALRRLGGRLWIEGALDAGATVYFTLGE